MTLQMGFVLFEVFFAVGLVLFIMCLLSKISKQQSDIKRLNYEGEKNEAERIASKDSIDVVANRISERIRSRFNRANKTDKR